MKAFVVRAGLVPEEFDTKEEALAYIEGMKAGFHEYAWWKDGVQYVGTTGKTLAKAIAPLIEAEKSFKN